MTNTMKVVAIGAMMAVSAVCRFSFAQDDIDALLKDLDSGSDKKPAAAKAEAPQSEPKAEEKAEEPAESKAEEKAEEPAESKTEAKSAEAEPVETAAEKSEEAKEEKPAVAEAAQPAVLQTVAPANPDSELLANISATEKLRREALDAQAKREIMEARACMENEEYGEAVRHYGLAQKLLNDRPSSKQLIRECNQGIGEGVYRAALQEYDLGRREKAQELMEKALDRRHPKARKVLEKWLADAREREPKPDVSEIKHRMNEEDYKSSREAIRKHLKRSRQYLALKDMKHALEECEVVLVNDPYNRDAIRIRQAIQKKRKVILQQERVASRDGMIADVDEAWRPVYAVNAAQLNETTSETVKTQTGDDPERTMEQDIEKRMKEMRLPTISFKPPATIIEAIDFFRTASKDYDRPDIPIEKRGFNFVLRTPQGAIKHQAGGGEEESSDDFASNDGGDSASGSSNGLPPIPTITASDITFYEALKLVCDSVDYKFIIRGPVVMVMHKDMSTAELLSRKYDVLDAFLERMTAASSDVKEMKSAGFGGGSKKSDEGDGENQERDWKEFFSQMGVKWPEGSSIMYIKTLGKLYVRNTRENLAEFEKVLQELGSQPKLIEIETRFVEVSQEDLNSLGFEWILNSDYSLNLGQKLGKALGVSNSTFGNEGGSQSWERSLTGKGGRSQSSDGTATGFDHWKESSDGGGNPRRVTDSSSEYTGNRLETASRSLTGGGSYADTYTRTVPYNTKDGRLIRDPGGDRNLGINAFGGTSDQQNGNRYLSTDSNHISGSKNSTNDQFMRVNAFLGEADLSMILHMLSQRSDTDLLSAPKVVTKSGENAVIKVVTEYIYPQDYDVQLQSSSSSGGGGGSSGGSSSAILAVVEPQNFTMREVGVILDVTPTYSEQNGGTIDLELKPSVVDEPTWKNYGMKIPFTGNPSNGGGGIGWLTDLGTGAVTAFNSAVTSLINANADDIAAAYVDAGLNSMNPSTITYYDAPMEQPFFPVRSIDSKVSITPGSTVVMGGLITEQRKAMDDKIPFLGDLPYVGRLFRSHAEQTIKKNLLIFVTGRLITPSGRELSVNQEQTEEESAEVKAAPTAE